MATPFQPSWAQPKTKPRRRGGRRGTVKPGSKGLGPGALPSKPSLGSKPGAPAAPRPGMAPRAAVRPKPHRASPDSLYNREVDTANRQGESRLGNLGQQEQSIRFDFGIDDPTNPNSRIEGLKRAYLARSKAASVGLANQGQLYAGAHERALSRTRMEEEQARADLRRQFDTAITGIGAEKAGVKFDTEEQKNQAFEDWLARAPESEGSVGAAPAAPALPKPAAPKPAPPKRGEAGGEPIATSSKPQPKAGDKVGTVTQGSKGVGPGFLPSGPQASGQAQPKSKGPSGDRLRARLRSAKRKGQNKKVKRIQRKLRRR